MVDNIVTASVTCAGRTKTRPLYQYDYGQVLKLTGIDLPAAYEVHFSNSEFGESTTQIGNADGVLIPDAYLQSGADVYVWLYLHSGTEDGETVYKILIPVQKRAAITPEQPTPVQQDTITQAIAALNDAVEQTAQDVEDAEAAAETARSAAASAHNNAIAAGQSAEAAAESASQAASSARTATAKASEAAQSASAAETANTAAAASATTAQTAATTASGKADEASASANTAAAKATEAASSAADALTAARDAAASEDAAEAAASSAQAGATSAAESAQDAYEAAETTEGLMLIPAAGGASASVATVTDAANDQPMALKINILPAQAGSGTPAPDNIRAISGWTGAVIRRSGSDTSNPTVYSVTFPTAAGTVYGGTLEIAKDGTGTLTVDWAYLDGTGWVLDESADGFVSYRRNGCPAGTKTQAFDAGEAYASFTDLYVMVAGKVGVQFPRINFFSAFIRVPEGFDLSNVQLVYPTSVPQTYTLTAEQIKSIFGTNNVWADCGSTQITAYYADKTLLITAAEQRIENLTVSSETLPAGSPASVEKQENADGINLHFGIPKGADGQSGGVTDVQVAGTSVVQDGVANVPMASLQKAGVVMVNADRGITMLWGTYLDIINASEANTKAGGASKITITPAIQHAAAFYGLAKAAGADMANVSGATVGIYPEAQKSAISTMLNSPVSVPGTTPTITALSGIQYVCGEVATLDITLPASGIVDVVFESGSTPTVLTTTPPTGMTVEWANGFDSTALEANTLYELNIRMVGTKCLGVTGTWS